MGTIEVIFNTDNAVFDDDPSSEIERVMSVAARIVDTSMAGEYPLFDINGNTIGFVRITNGNTDTALARAYESGARSEREFPRNNDMTGR